NIPQNLDSFVLLGPNEMQKQIQWSLSPKIANSDTPQAHTLPAPQHHQAPPHLSLKLNQSNSYKYNIRSSSLVLTCINTLSNSFRLIIAAPCCNNRAFFSESRVSTHHRFLTFSTNILHLLLCKVPIKCHFISSG